MATMSSNDNGAPGTGAAVVERVDEVKAAVGQAVEATGQQAGALAEKAAASVNAVADKVPRPHGNIAGHNYPLNVGREERALSLVAGVPLALVGAARRGPLGTLMLLAGGEMVYRGLTGHCPVYQLVGLDTAQAAVGRNVSVPYEQGIRVEESISIGRPRLEVYDFWRNFENLPRFMQHLERVTVLDAERSHWVAKAPAGTAVEWDAEIINEEPGTRIGWRSLSGSQVPNAGSVQFLDDGAGGTLLKVELEYKPPAGLVGAAVAKLFGEEPAQQVREDLRRLKHVLETGQVERLTPGQRSAQDEWAPWADERAGD
jgi:uncharacterized membrane protein